MSSENAMEVTDLTKRYDGILAVDNITFYVKKGEIFGFLMQTKVYLFWSKQKSVSQQEMPPKHGACKVMYDN